MSAHPLQPVSPAWIEQTISESFRRWDCESSMAEVCVEFSTRMSRSLGRAFPARKLVRLRHDLQVQPREVLRQVLVHELAHLVAWQQFGPRIKPHGRQWQALMRDAGLEPSVTLTVPELETGRYRVRRYHHHCPVCRTSRVAYRNMHRWRCAACLQSGRSGRLQIEELA